MKNLQAFVLPIMIILLSNKEVVAFYCDTIPALNNQFVNYNQYLKKSHDQKVASTVLATGGAIIAGVGLGLTLSSLNGLLDPTAPPPKDYGSTPDILMIGGVALIAAALPIHFASKKNKKKARLYINSEVLTTKRTVHLMAIGIKIN